MRRGYNVMLPKTTGGGGWDTGVAAKLISRVNIDDDSMDDLDAYEFLLSSANVE